MSTTRRTLLGGLLAAPMLAALAKTASGESAQAGWGTVSEGWAELRKTKESHDALERVGASIEPVAPATLVVSDAGKAVRFPARAATGDPSLTDLSRAQGYSQVDGGLILRTPKGEFRLAELDAGLENGVVSARYRLDDVEAGVLPLFRCALAEGTLLAEPAPPGQPLEIWLTEVPCRPTPEALDALEALLGSKVFTPDTVVARLNAAGVYTPPAAAPMP
ncbi:hypothetical protein L3Q67_24630 [Saccharothrix sp. AJ9571]|nr:hypothetical protein L3Q67_24630 [Saccharothrix sp. AJ9571]